MIEGSGSGSILLTNGSGSGPKNMWIRRIGIRNTALKSVRYPSGGGAAGDRHDHDEHQRQGRQEHEGGHLLQRGGVHEQRRDQRAGSEEIRRRGGEWRLSGSRQVSTQRDYTIPRAPECLFLCPNWLPPLPLPQASVSPPGTKGGGGQQSLAGARARNANSDDWRASPALCILCGYQHFCILLTLLNVR
jgi:hypothetical protein